MKIFKIQFNSFARDITLKTYPFFDYPIKKDWIYLKKILISKNKEYDIKSGRTPNTQKNEYWNGDYEFLTMNYIDRDIFTIMPNIDDKISDIAVEECKQLLEVPKGNLLVSNARTIGLSVITDRSLFVNQNMFWLKIDENKYTKEFLNLFFNFIFLKFAAKRWYNKYLSKDEFLYIKIPSVKIDAQREIISKVEPLISKIKELKVQIKEPKLIADEVFSEYFKLNLSQYSNLEKKHIFRENLLNLSKSAQLRSSLKFHHPKLDFILEKIKGVKTVKFKQLLEEPIRRGVQPEYDENGEIQVVKTANLKNGYIDLSEAEYVNDEFFKIKRKKAGVKYLDILIASTGTGSIGKVDIWESNEEALADGHISIIRVNQEKVNPYYLTYYLRSIFGYSQVEANFSGMSNQIEIYSNDIERFEILFPDKTVQDQIVKEIDSKLNEQRKLIKQIERLKQRIGDLIEKAVLEEETK
ncbi:Type I restriction modification DNA specificity domain-containing protein [Thermoanaerobacter thermohydrosulfuricus]|uniref:Type I restriction modification DNA specificity domain-containing protein n=1 Tax=Thermoanaerobacter thermohydrosulfuricus TaxID=1516 RepID=A0A1G7TCX0_THETY|nr:restriction endonuclease subunit S [Thermoanaerobacter thermohydrosulfuricus]SDG32440.1 Type I restriction modification DNA specificity domain-containing protein [Thermoanaerobacter thermohydrosulfuricus]